ncbi:MAG: hypothetical protein QOI29_4706 [Mycobacterium sp.]|jgi:hypothetical protein|nr:hypothetical protein [Mycobacterium sp.]
MSSALTRIERAGDQYLGLPASFNSAVDDCHDSEVPATGSRCPTQRSPIAPGAIRVVDYLEHGRTFPNQRANAGS